MNICVNMCSYTHLTSLPKIHLQLFIFLFFNSLCFFTKLLAKTFEKVLFTSHLKDVHREVFLYYFLLIIFGLSLLLCINHPIKNLILF